MAGARRAGRGLRADGGGGAEASGFGAKKISLLGSVALNFNNATGPALVCFPLLLQQAGWMFPVALLWFIGLSSGFVATMLGEAMQRIPGNRNLTLRYEYTTLVKHYLGKWPYRIALVAYSLSLLATSIAAIVITGQVMDNAIDKIFGRSFAYSYDSWPPTLVNSVQNTSGHGMTWSDGGANIISLGLLMVMAICVPMGFVSLDENMWLQWVSCFGVVVFSIEFLIELGKHAFGHLDEIPYLTPAVTDLRGQIPVVGVIIFANAYMVTIPSWLNEKKPGANVQIAVWVPIAAAMTLSTWLMLIGAWAFELMTFPFGLGADDRGVPKDGAGNILNFLLVPSAGITTYLSGYLWTLTVLVPLIPVLGIMVRYNLVSSNVCSKTTAFLAAVVLPWIFTAFFYERDLLLTFCNWMAVIVQGYVNFVIPPLVYRQALIMYPDDYMPSDNLDTLQSSKPQQGDLPPSEIAKNGNNKKLRLLVPADDETGIPAPLSGVKSIVDSAYEGQEDLQRLEGGHLTDNPGQLSVPLVTGTDSEDLNAPLLGRKKYPSLEDKELPIRALSRSWGVNRVIFSTVLASILFVLCTVAVLLSIYGSLVSINHQGTNSQAPVNDGVGDQQSKHLRDALSSSQYNDVSTTLHQHMSILFGP